MKFLTRHIFLPPAMRRLLFLPALFLLPSCTGVVTPVAPTAPAAGDTRPVPAEGTFAVDLETTLKLAAGQNVDLAIAIEKANRASARADAAVFSLLPDLAAGASFAKQNGLLQETLGSGVATKRVNDSRGLGGSAVPGVSLDLPLGRAVFAPLASRQERRAAAAGAKAAEHQILSDAAVAYLELVRAAAGLRMSREIEGAAGKLADSTKAFAKAGEGLNADAERAMAGHLLRQSQSAKAGATLAQRSAALARVLHLPVTLTLIPADRSMSAVDLVNPDEPLARMVATALRCRPEAAQMQAEVKAAASRLTEQRIKPFLPGLTAGYSNYDFGAGRGDSVQSRDNREEVAAMIYWKLEGLGFGNMAAAREKKADLNLAKLEESRTLDLIAGEIAAARADVIAQRTRMPLGKQVAAHARKAYELTAARLQEAEGLPIEALDSIRTLAEARQAEVDAVLDYNIAQHRLLAALGHPH